jgi:flagellar M-ring protein FliF
MNLNLRQIASKLSLRGWAVVGGAVVAAVIFIFVLVSLASKPSYTTLMAGINPAQTSKITSSLSTAGIPFVLQNNGTAIGVPSSQEATARVDLANAGLLNSAGADSTLSTLTTSSSLGESNFQQQTQYQAALESQLDNGIEQFTGVESAQVSIVLPDPEDELFTTSATPSSASVILNDNGNLSASTAKSIADYVKNSVASLSLNDITITDQDGNLLWPRSSSDSGSNLLSKQQAEQAYDAEMTGKVNAMLDATVGLDKAYVSVNGNLNTNRTTLNSVNYGTNHVLLTNSSTNERLKGNGINPTGAAGTTATQGAATYAQTGNGTETYADKTAKPQFGVNKTVAHTIVAPGAIKNQSISVLVSDAVPVKELKSIRSAVENTAGYSAKRGDTISVTQVAFAKVPVAVAAAASSTKILKYAKWLAVGLGVLLFLLFVSRMLRRREQESFGEPTWLRELETPRSLASLEAQRMTDEEPTRVPALRSPFNLARKQVEELVDRDPERVASQVRQWMNED